jgi:hypothetical protein
MRKKRPSRKTKTCGFTLTIALWVILSILCYEGMIVFDPTTVSGAIILGFILTSSMLSLAQLLKAMYDKAYPILYGED